MQLSEHEKPEWMKRDDELSKHNQRVQQEYQRIVKQREQQGACSSVARCVLMNSKVRAREPQGAAMVVSRNVHVREQQWASSGIRKVRYREDYLGCVIVGANNLRACEHQCAFS